MTDLLPSADASTPGPIGATHRVRADEGGAADTSGRRHFGVDRRPDLRRRVPRRRRHRATHRRRGTRRSEESPRRRRSVGTDGAAHARGTAHRPRWLARRTRADRERHGDPADRDQQHPQTPAGRARSRSERARQSDHRCSDRAVGLRSDHDDQQRRSPAHQGRTSRRRRCRASPHPFRSRSAHGRLVHHRGPVRIDRLPLRRRCHRRRCRGDRPGDRVQPERVRRVAFGLAVRVGACRPRRLRAPLPARPRRPGGCARGARNSDSPSSCCSTPTSPSSRSTAEPAPARRSSPSPPDSTRWSSRAATNDSASTGRWSPSAEPTSGSSPADSTRSSTRGWPPSTTQSSPCPIAAASTTPGRWSTS